MTDTIIVPASLSVAQLIERLSEQCGLFGQLIELAGRQRMLIDESRTDELLALLGRRQQLVDRLQRVGAAMEPYRNRWSTFMAGLPDEARHRIRELLDELARSQQQVAAIDARDSELLRDSQQQLLQQTGRIQQTSTALRAYGAAGATAGQGFGRQA